MSSLEKQIEQWRETLSESDAMSQSDIGELEEHLREEISTLGTSGLSQEETFLVARHRLGQTTVLSKEFAKVNGSRRLVHHLWWMMAGVLAYLLAVHFGGAVSAGSLAATELTDLTPRIRGLIAVAARVGTFCMVGGFVLWLCVRFSAPRSHGGIRIARRVRIALLLALIVESLGLVAMRMFCVPLALKRMGAQDYGQIIVVESIGAFVWNILGPVLLGAILLKIHLVSKRELSDQ